MFATLSPPTPLLLRHRHVPAPGHATKTKMGMHAHVQARKGQSAAADSSGRLDPTYYFPGTRGSPRRQRQRRYVSVIQVHKYGCIPSVSVVTRDRKCRAIEMVYAHHTKIKPQFFVPNAPSRSFKYSPHVKRWRCFLHKRCSLARLFEYIIIFKGMRQVENSHGQRG